METLSPNAATRTICGTAFWLVLLFAAAAFPSAYHGFDRSIYANSDMDFLSLYQAASVVGGMQMKFNPHPGYFYFISLALWYDLLEALGWIAGADLRSLLTAPDFPDRFLKLIVAGRWFSVVEAWLMAALVFVAARQQGFRPISAFGWALLFALGGGGLAAQSVLMRTELMSMLLVFVAALALIPVTGKSGYWSLARLFVAGLCIHLALTVKIQAIVLALPLALLPTVQHWKIRGLRPQPFARPHIATAVAVFAAFAVMFATVQAPFLLRETPALYQSAIALFVLAAALGYGLLISGSALQGAVGFAAVASGFLSAYLLNAIVFEPSAQCSVFNFLDLARQFALPPPDAAATTGNALAATAGAAPAVTATPAAAKASDGLIAGQIIPFLVERLSRFDYPFGIIAAAVPFGWIPLLRRRRYLAVLQAAFPYAIAIYAIVVFWAARKGFIYFYAIYVEPWIIVAALMTLRQLLPDPSAARRKIALRVVMLVGAACIAANVSTRLTDPKSANTRGLEHACQMLFWAPALRPHMSPMCTKAGYPVWPMPKPDEDLAPVGKAPNPSRWYNVITSQPTRSCTLAWYEHAK
jgi:hypothetical protein